MKTRVSLKHFVIVHYIAALTKRHPSSSSLFRCKDSIPKELCSHLVYKYFYSNCNITYYSVIVCHHNIRFRELLSLSALTGKHVSNSKKLPVKDHCLFFNHMSLFEDFSILAYK